MDTDLQTSIIERFNSLQPEIQEVIMNSNYEQELTNIADKYKMSIDQAQSLALDTIMVLLGEIHPDEYDTELIDDLKFPKNVVDQIVTEVNEKVLKNILPIIKQNFIDDDIEEEEVKAVPLPPKVQDGEDIPIPQSAPQKTKNDDQKGIFKDAGIEMMEDEVAHLAIIENKLNKPTIKTQDVRDYTLPKMSREKPTDDHAKPSDPYHESL